MITEDYCSFEVAKLLKEKGFDAKCYTYYDTRGEGYVFNTGGVAERITNAELRIYSTIIIPECVRPTLSMAMKWLREVQQLHISIKPTWVLGDMKEPCRWEYDIISLATAVDLMYYVGNSTYEEAVEAACIYALKNLI